MALPRTILASLDLDDLAPGVLDYAAELAACLGAKLHVVHAAPRPVLDPEVPDSLVNEALQQVTAAALAKLEPVVASHRTASYLASVRVELGEAVPVILDAAKLLGAELIITGSHGRHGISRLVLGSVAEQIARRATCPVTLVRAPAHHGA